MSSYVRSATDFFVASIEKEREAATIDRRETPNSRNISYRSIATRFLTIEKRRNKNEREEILTTNAAKYLSLSEENRGGTTRRRNNDERTEREKETKKRRMERRRTEETTSEERAVKPEEEKAITYSENRPNCPRPRSYGSPHCRDAGAKRTFVTFPSPLRLLARTRRKNGPRWHGPPGSKNKRHRCERN